MREIPAIRSFVIAIGEKEPECCSLLAECVLEAGHQVACKTASFVELKSQLALTAIDLIIVDVFILIEEGDALPESARFTDIPLLITAKKNDEEGLKHATLCGATACLMKPFDKQEAQAILAMTIRGLDKLRTLTCMLNDMEARLESRKYIERAKGILMKKLELDEAEAFRQLKDSARRNRRKLVDVAKAILLSSELSV
jgi:two-component system, response regulator PdtaR